ISHCDGQEKLIMKNYKSRSISRQVFCLAIILILSPTIFAQSGVSLQGQITDERNAAIVGAQVQLRSRSGVAVQATTNESGAYEFKDLRAGDYVLEASAKGFATSTMKLQVANSSRADVTLSVERVSESVVVTASGTAQRADEISKAVSVIDNQTIEARRELTLPESLRGVPGVRVQQQGSIGALTTVRLRGQRNFDTAVLFDGLRVRDASDINGSPAVVLPDLLNTDLDRIEILRGSGSSIYGTNAI